MADVGKGVGVPFSILIRFAKFQDASFGISGWQKSA